MNDVPMVLIHLLWVIPLVLLIVFMGSPRFRGTVGQARVGRLLAAGLQRSQYTVFNDLTISAGGGSVHIEHLVISQFGVFVIKTVNRSGRISGAEFQDRWTQHRYGRMQRFDNPVHQNLQAIDALDQIIHLPRSSYHSIVIFNGSGRFDEKVPANVMPAERLISWIRKRSKKTVPPEDADRALQQIDAARLGFRSAGIFDRWSLLRLSLLVLLLVAGWFAFRDEIHSLRQQWLSQLERNAAPPSPLLHADGSPKSEQEMWEDTLSCAFSSDTGRCACYEPNGKKADLGSEQCQFLSERGSILRQ